VRGWKPKKRQGDEARRLEEAGRRRANCQKHLSGAGDERGHGLNVWFAVTLGELLGEPGVEQGPREAMCPVRTTKPMEQRTERREAWGAIGKGLAGEGAKRGGRV